MGWDGVKIMKGGDGKYRKRVKRTIYTRTF